MNSELTKRLRDVTSQAYHYIRKDATYAGPIMAVKNPTASEMMNPCQES